MNLSAGEEFHWNISQDRGVCKERLSHSVRAKLNLPCKDPYVTRKGVSMNDTCLRTMLCKSCNQSKKEKRVWYRLRCICLGHSVPSVSIYWQTQRYVSDIGASHIIPGWMACSALLPYLVVQARTMYMNQYLQMKCRKVVFFWLLSPLVTKIKSILNPETTFWAQLSLERPQLSDCVFCGILQESQIQHLQS